MPRFAANLSMMFQEIGFLDRFDAAARAGFKAVEFLFPYEHPPEAIAERLEKNRLSLALFNTIPAIGPAASAALPRSPDASRNSAMGSTRQFSTGRRQSARCCTRWRGCGLSGATRNKVSASISKICAGPPTAWLPRG
jgi:hydroxypyruvate isomerase